MAVACGSSVCGWWCVWWCWEGWCRCVLLVYARLQTNVLHVCVNRGITTVEVNQKEGRSMDKEVEVKARNLYHFEREQTEAAHRAVINRIPHCKEGKHAWLSYQGEHVCRICGIHEVW